MKLNTNRSLRNLVFAAVCLALCLALPFLTGQVPQIGNMLCPMHLPVLLAGFLCGPWWALAVGLIAPVLRHALFSMPPLHSALAMSFELLTYGLVSGLLYRILPKKTVNIYLSLIAAMVAGRIVWGVAASLIFGAFGKGFSWAIFFAGAFTNAVPGIILQLVVVPLVVIALKKSGILNT